MKKIIVLLVLVTQSVFCEGIDIEFNGRYGFGLSELNANSVTSETTDDGDLKIKKFEKQSAMPGGGIGLEFVFKKSISENFGFLSSISYNTTTIESESKSVDEEYIDVDKNSITASFIPLTFGFYMVDKSFSVQPYISAALLVNYFLSYEREYTYSYNEGPEDTSNSVLDLGLGLGAESKVGLYIPLSDGVALNANLFYRLATSSMLEEKRTSKDGSGEEYTRTTKFVDEEGTYTSTGTTSYREQYYDIGIDSWGLAIGLAINL
ncbi:MAG: PorT family protein [Fibrobacterales bacterium]